MHARLDTEQISLLTENLARARSDLAAAEGRLDAASGRAGADGAGGDRALGGAAARAPRPADGQLQSMLGRLGPSHPGRAGLRAQLAEVDRAIAAEIGRVVAAIEADVRADRERVTALEQDLSDAQAQIARDSQAQVPLNAMLRDVEASRSLLQAVLERMQQTAQQPAIEAPDAHEISLALLAGPAELSAHRAADGGCGDVRGRVRPAAGLCVRAGRAAPSAAATISGRCSACPASR